MRNNLIPINAAFYLSQLEALDELATKLGRSRNDLIRTAVDEMLTKTSRDPVLKSDKGRAER